MKTWNAPELQELNINETANGIFDCEFEFCIWTNDKKATPEEDS